MSYSYIKSVFPNFQVAKIYNDALYSDNSFNSLPIKEETNNILNITPINDEPLQSIAQFQSGLRSEKLTKEEFTQNDNSDTEVHDIHLQHVLQCVKCKEILIKQLDIEQDRAKREEVLEIVSYVMFGLFVLLLIQTIQKNKVK